MTQTEVLQEYASMVDRLQKENADLKVQLEVKVRDLSQVTSTIADLQGKSTIMERIEQTLKDKIHSMQQEYYQANRERVLKQQEDNVYGQRLSEMQEALVSLERKFDLKEREISQMYSENQAMAQELQRSEERYGEQ